MTRVNTIQLSISSSDSMPISLPPPYTSSGARNIRENSADFLATTELLIGPHMTPTRYLLHTTLLTTQSPYFRAALNPNSAFLESSTNSISLPDISADIFELFVSWLYNGQIKPVPYKDGKPAYYTLLHLWMLADRLDFEACRNGIVDCMAECADRTNSVLTPSDTRILYEQIPDSPSGDKLRKLVLDLFAFKKTDRLLGEHPDRWHAAFLRDLAVRLKRPCEQGLLRHNLRMWIPEAWYATRACEACRTILPPRYGAVGCEDCRMAWCVRCIGEGTGTATWEDGRGRFSFGRNVKEGRDRKWESCKPWRRARCRVYHEHEETERCAKIFMER